MTTTIEATVDRDTLIDRIAILVASHQQDTEDFDDDPTGMSDFVLRDRIDLYADSMREIATMLGLSGPEMDAKVDEYMGEHKRDMGVEEDDGSWLCPFAVTEGKMSTDPVDNSGRYRVIKVEGDYETLWTNDLSLDEATIHADRCTKDLMPEEVRRGTTFRIEEDA